MRKGLVRATGGCFRGALTTRASVLSMRRSCKGKLVTISKTQVFRCRRRLRDALSIYLALKPEAVAAPDLRRLLRKVGSNAARLYNDPTNQKWADRLDELLTKTRKVSGARVARSFLHRSVYCKEAPPWKPNRLNELERALAHGIFAYAGKEIMVGLETHMQTIKQLSKLKNFEPSTTTYRDPALTGLVADLLPIWEEVTGNKGWARFDKEEADWVSPLHPWLRTVLGPDAPTNDQLVKVVRLQKVSK